MYLTLFRKVTEFVLTHRLERVEGRQEFQYQRIVTWRVVPMDLPKQQPYPRTEEGEP